MAKTQKKTATLATVLSTSTVSELHGYGVLFAGGWSKALPICPDTAGEKQRPDSDSLASVIVEIKSRGITRKVKGLPLADVLLRNLRTFTIQAENAIKRAEKEKEKAEKAKAK